MISNTIRTCFPVAAAAVADKATDINKLNVFPVPDGDTGTNMSLTLGTVVKEVEALPADASMADVAKAITHGSLMGARGNSGVITSQILRGVAEGLVDAKGEHATTADVAHALRRGVKVAFKAVRKPVEGTILTVLRDVSARADACEAEHMELPECLEALVVEAYESVARTPDLLPVLKENGVVDSGAYGIATFLEAFVNAYLGHEGEMTDFKTTVSTEPVPAGDSAAKANVDDKVSIELNDDWAGSEYRYCTEFLFHSEKPDFDEDATLAFLASMGDCELLVGNDPDYKIHVHSNEPDKVLHHMLELGQIFEVFIHNMDLEAADRTAGIAADKASAEKADETPVEKADGESTPAAEDVPAGSPVEDATPAPKVSSEPAKPLGFVAVAAGSGEADILRSLGVDYIVSGGQTMNPSTADILAAIEKVNADSVVVLPDNGNIRMAAEAAANACDGREVAVVPTKTVLQAFAAMFVVDPDSSLEENVAEMNDAIGEIRDGEVTTAVRDSAAADGTPIHAGDVMGIEGGKITVVGSDVQEVTLDIIHSMQEQEEGDTLTILAGSDMDDDSFSKLTEAIEEAEPDLELDAHRGEQPLYPVVFSIE